MWSVIVRQIERVQLEIFLKLAIVWKAETSHQSKILPFMITPILITALHQINVRKVLNRLVLRVLHVVLKMKFFGFKLALPASALLPVRHVRKFVPIDVLSEPVFLARPSYYATLYVSVATIVASRYKSLGIIAYTFVSPFTHSIR